jgi:hypothetical protein
MRLHACPGRIVLSLLSLALAGGLACAPASEAPAGGSGGDGGGTEPGSGGRGGTSSGGAGPSSGGGAGGAVQGSGGSASGGSGGGGAGGGSGGGSGGSVATGGAGGKADASSPDPMDAAADAQAPAGDGGGLGPLPPGAHKVVLLVGDIHVTDQSRLQLIQILESMKDSHGVVVQVMDSRVAKASVLMDASLVIAGPNNNYCSDNPDPSLKTMPIPLMVSRDCKTTQLGLGTMMNTQEYITDLPVKINIIKSDHPLAAGLSGIVPVEVTRCRLVRGRDLGPDAIKIAKSPADATPVFPESWPIFAYDKGGMMVGGFRAPAKRMGFFWHRPSAVTPEGRKLFVAAVDWLLRP